MKVTRLTLLLVLVPAVAWGKVITVGQGQGGWTLGVTYSPINASIGDQLVSFPIGMAFFTPVPSELRVCHCKSRSICGGGNSAPSFQNLLLTFPCRSLFNTNQGCTMSGSFRPMHVIFLPSMHDWSAILLLDRTSPL